MKVNQADIQKKGRQQRRHTDIQLGKIRDKHTKSKADIHNRKKTKSHIKTF